MELMDPVMADVLRRKSPVERLEIMWGLWDSAREMIQRILRHQHPEWTDEAVNREVVRRLSHGAV
jgi:hypothetical protein